jgi:GT2 family glycosyltransferase
MRPPLTAIVVCLNEGAHVERTVENLRATIPSDAEIVVVDEGSTDGSADFVARTNGRLRLTRTTRLGVPGARNHGAAMASGEVLVFADAHIETPIKWWVPLIEALDDPRVGAAAPAIYDMNHPDAKGFGMHFVMPNLVPGFLFKRGEAPYAVPALPGCCLAMRRDVFDAVGGFDGGMIDWGMVDSELCLRLWLLGYELRLIPQVEVGHLFREVLPYPVSRGSYLHNKLRLAWLHFGRSRLATVIDALRTEEDFGEALATIAESDVMTRRADLHRRRQHDEAWFFDRFDQFE